MNEFSRIIQLTVLPPILICTACILPAPKRTKFWPLLILVFTAIQLVPPGFFGLVFGPNIPSSLAWFVAMMAYYLLIALFFWGCCKVHGTAAFYLATMAYSFLLITYSLQGVALCLLPSAYEKQIYVLLCVLLAVTVYLFWRWKVFANTIYEINGRQLIAVFSVFCIASVIFFYFIRLLRTNLSVEIHTCLLLIHFGCVCILYILGTSNAAARLQHEQQLLLQMLQSRQKQYDTLKSSMERINQSCHDMKHQILALRHIGLDASQEAFLDDALKNIQTYESVLDTGNEALNAVLVEKAMECHKKNIHLHCMADGEALSFMEPVDIYNIFGNALDNAVECITAEQTPQAHAIRVQASRKQHFYMIQIENDCAIPPQFENGLPLTTKKDTDRHGYGVKSIVYSAEKYQGVVSIRAENRTFTLRILIPQPSNI